MQSANYNETEKKTHSAANSISISYKSTSQKVFVNFIIAIRY